MNLENKLKCPWCDKGKLIYLTLLHMCLPKDHFGCNKCRIICKITDYTKKYDSLITESAPEVVAQPDSVSPEHTSPRSKNSEASSPD